MLINKDDASDERVITQDAVTLQNANDLVSVAVCRRSQELASNSIGRNRPELTSFGLPFLRVYEGFLQAGATSVDGSSRERNNQEGRSSIYSRLEKEGSNYIATGIVQPEVHLVT